jgi:hypothetical protein
MKAIGQVLVTVIIAFSHSSGGDAGPNDKEKSPEPERLPVYVKHLWQTKSKDGWKLESWVDGSSIPASYPVNVSFRITPEKEKQVDKPKATIHLKLLSKTDPKQFREAKTVAEWQLCSTMKKRKETIYDKAKRDFSPFVIFPPKERCWEALPKDPFASDRRNEGTAPLVAGEYILQVEMRIDGGPTFKLNLQDIQITKR